MIFPEGGNFTAARRDRAIARLRKLGLEQMAVRAEEMIHVLAPRPGGVLAALEAAPEADVLMVAHTGLDHLVTVSDLWRELPMDKQITMRWWQVAREEIPADREERIDWLFGWWERVDEWIEENRVETPDVPPSAVERWPTHRSEPAGGGSATAPTATRHGRDSGGAPATRRASRMWLGHRPGGAAGAATSCGARRRCR